MNHDHDDLDDDYGHVEVVGPVTDTYRNKQVDMVCQQKQFDVTYNEEDFEQQQQIQQQLSRDSNEEEEEDDEDNPMAKKLKKMKQQLRNQIHSSEKPSRLEDSDEDNQGYDDYKSPYKQSDTNPQHTFTLSPPQQQPPQQPEEKKPTQGQQLPVGSIIGAANYDKIKNSKLFQKFLQKEVGSKQPEQQLLQATSSKVSLQQFTQKAKPAEKAKSAQKKQEPVLDISHQTHEDFYESKIKPNQKHRQQHYMQDPNIDLSLEAIQHQHQYMDDSQFFHHPPQTQPDFYAPYFPKTDNKAYLLDQSDLNNEGELIGYSEQILGKINDMAPGIPNQDEVLCHQPPEAFVNMMHDQFNNEMPWLIRNKTHEYTGNATNMNTNVYAPEMGGVKQEMGEMKTEMHRMKQDYEYVNNKFMQLQDKYNRLQADYDKDKAFYEEALEVRMSQLEQLEQDNESLNRKYEDARRNEMDLQAQIDQIMFDKEMIQRSLNNTDKTKQELGKKEEEMYVQIREMQEQVKDKEFEVERSNQEVQRLKQQIERGTQENERLKQQIEYQEQQVIQKDQEKHSLQSQINDLKQRLQQEQTEQHFVRNESEELKNEILMLKQQLSMSNNVQEQLRQQVFDMKDKLTDIEHREFLANSTKDLMQKEIQQLRNQLNQANQFIQQQAMFYTQAQSAGNTKPPVFQVQPMNAWEEESTKSRESAVPTTQSKKRQSDNEQQFSYGAQQQNQNHQLRSKNMGNLLQWDEQPTAQQPPLRSRPQTSKPAQANMESNVSFPSRGGAMQDPNSSIVFPSRGAQQSEPTIAFPSRGQQQQPESNISFQSRQQKSQMESNVAFPSRQQKSMSSFEPYDQSSFDNRPMTKVPQKNQQQATTLNKPAIEQRQKQLQNIESNLLQLNLERDKYKAEFDKIPENAKTIAQRRRREELERELDILGKNIASLKTKLRDIESQH